MAIVFAGSKQEKPHDEPDLATAGSAPVVGADPTGSQIAREVYNRLDPSQVSFDRELLSQLVTRLVTEVAEERRAKLSASEQASLAREIIQDIVGYGPLDALLSDADISEVMVNGPRSVWIERRGVLSMTEHRFRDEEHVRAIAQRIARGVGRRVDDAHPICDARLPDGSRVSLVLAPVALDGTTITIRKFPDQNLTLDDLAAMGSMSRRMAGFLATAVSAGANILVSGGTGSGKTTLLNALSGYVPTRERIITIEDAAELRLQQPHVVRLETRIGSSEASGAQPIPIRELVKTSLRMRPNRIIVGEVRAGEAFDMLQAMSTGHDGSMSTVHANGPRESLMRIENMVLMAVELPIRAIRMQISSALDLIVQVERSPDGRRRVVAISEVGSMEGDMISMQDLFRWSGDGEAHSGDDGRQVVHDEAGFIYTGLRPMLMKKAGLRGRAQPMSDVLGLSPRLAEV